MAPRGRDHRMASLRVYPRTLFGNPRGPATRSKAVPDRDVSPEHWTHRYRRCWYGDFKTAVTPKLHCVGPCTKMLRTKSEK